MLDMSEGFVGRIQFAIGYNSVQLTPRTGAGFYATDLEGIEFVYFSDKDVVRHKLVQMIVRAYEEHSEREENAA